jgi:hypothetical protein
MAAAASVTVRESLGIDVGGGGGGYQCGWSLGFLGWGFWSSLVSCEPTWGARTVAGRLPPWRLQRRRLCLGQRRGRGCVGEDGLGVGAQGRLGGGMGSWNQEKSADVERRGQIRRCRSSEGRVGEAAWSWWQDRTAKIPER